MQFPHVFSLLLFILRPSLAFVGSAYSAIFPLCFPSHFAAEASESGKVAMISRSSGASRALCPLSRNNVRALRRRGLHSEVKLYWNFERAQIFQDIIEATYLRASLRNEEKQIRFRIITNRIQLVESTRIVCVCFALVSCRTK